MPRSFAISFAATLALAAATAWAAQVTVSQKDKQFAETEIEVHAGDTVVFRNDDSVTHNVMSRSKGYAFDLGAVKSGHSSEVAFDSPGDVEVRCAIHPKMKMTVHVR